MGPKSTAGVDRYLQEVFDTGRVEPLLTQAAAAAAENLAAIARTPFHFFQLGLFHWYRGRGSPVEHGGADLLEALKFITRVPSDLRQQLDDLIPGQILAGLGETPACPMGHADDWNAAAAALLRHGRRTRSRSAMAWAITLFESAAASHADEDPSKAGYLSNLAIAHRYRFELTGDSRDLSAAIDTGRAAIRYPNQIEPLIGLANALADRAEQSGTLTDLDAAVDAARTAVARTASDDPQLGPRLGALCNILRIMFERTGDLDDLTAAIEAGREAVASTEKSHPDLSASLGNLGLALQTRFERTGDCADLQAAVHELRAALAAADSEDPHQPAHLSNLAIALQVSAEITGSAADLDEAVDLGHAAVAAAAENAPLKAATMSNLAVALHTRFRRTGQRADLDAAIDLGSAAVSRTDADSPDRASRQSNHANALLERFQHYGDIEDLHAAVTAARAAAGASGHDRPVKAAYHCNLGNVLNVRFQRTGRLVDLDEAIESGQVSVRESPADHPDRRIYLSNLGNSLQVRWEHTGLHADLDQAVDACHEAAEATPPGHADRAAYLTNYGTALLSRFERNGSVEDLDAAIEAFRTAADAAGDSPYLATCLSNLGLALRHRFEHTAEETDISAAVETAEAAVAASPAGHPERGMCLSNLSIAYLNLFQASHAEEAIDTAVEAGRRAVEALPPGDPARAGYAINLGNALITRHQEGSRRDDLDAAVRAWRSAAEQENAPPWHRCAAAGQWGAAAADSADWHQADTAFETAVRLLALVAPRRLGLADQGRALMRFSGIACDAAACALQVGDPERAVATLELGRRIVLGQILQARSDVTELARIRPDLAERFLHLSTELDAAGDPSADSTRRWNVARDLDRLISKIQAVPQMSRFLLPPSVDALRVALGHRPVAVINVSKYRCDALLIDITGVRVVPLPKLTTDRAARALTLHLSLVRQLRVHRTLTPAQRAKTSERLRQLLTWLWTAVAAPVLDALDYRHREDSWPRLWWCPTGPLALLPLHAAQSYDHARIADSGVLDRVVSSYTATIHDLTRSGPARPRLDTRPHLLAVAVRSVKGQLPLPHVEREIEVVGRYFPAADSLLLTNEEATVSNISAALPTRTWLHFAGHSWQDLQNPGLTSLLLHDGRLTAQDIVSQRLDIDLGYLSSCETGLGLPDLPDEMLHVSGSLQIAGIRHVIATLWSIGDGTAPRIADQVYARLAASDGPSPEGAARALHATLRVFRATHPPQIWAPYFHAGA